jgi:integrase
MLGLRDGGNLAAGTRQTVGQWLDEWLAGRKLAIGPRTYLDYKTSLDRYVRPALGVIRLSRLSTADIQRLVNEMDGERKLGWNTVRLALIPLGAALAKAARLGKLTRNPFDDVERPAKERVERCVLDEDGQRKLRAVCDADDAWGPLILTLMMIGARPGELLALKWSDVDGDLLHLQRSLVQTEDGWVIRADMKTDQSRRTLPLSTLPDADVVLRALARQRKRVAALRLAAGPEWQDNDLIFPTATGSTHDTRNLTRRVLPRLLKRAGLPPMRLYDLRHTFASTLHANGVPVKVIAELMGDSELTVLRTYCHTSPTMLRDAADMHGLLVSAQPA